MSERHNTYSRRHEASRLRVLGYYVTSRVRCAARFAQLVGCSIHQAAQVFGIHAGGVWNAWRRIYPMRPQPVMDRKVERTRGCTECGAEYSHTVRGTCSPSAVALKLVASGRSVRDAAKQCGIRPQAVYAAREHRGRAA